MDMDEAIIKALADIGVDVTVEVVDVPPGKSVEDVIRERKQKDALESVRERMAMCLEAYELMKQLEASIAKDLDKRTPMDTLNEILLASRLSDLA